LLLSLALMTAALFEISALRAKVAISIAIAPEAAPAFSLFVVIAIAGRRRSGWPPRARMSWSPTSTPPARARWLTKWLLP